jgi:hypothetical protein
VPRQGPRGWSSNTTAVMRRPLVLALLIALAAPACASANWFPATPVDTGATAFGGVDLARDGGGALVYVKGGQVWLSRMTAGAWNAPERVDTGAPGGASDPVVAVADGGAVVVTWRAADQVFGSYSDGGTFSAPVALGGGDVGPPAVDMAIQRTAWVVFRQGGDVRAVRLRRGAWEAVPGVLDIDPAAAAGAGAGRPRVAVAADGNALVVWSETPADGRARLYARRVTDLRPSALPQQVSLDTLAGAAGGAADSAAVAIEDDVSFAWVVFRQDVGGQSRVLARRLVGSLFDPPVAVDLGPGSRAPHVSMNGDGVGLAASATDAGDVVVSVLQHDAFGAPVAVGRGSAPLVAGAENRDLGVVWQADGGVVGTHAQRDAPLEPPVALGAGGAVQLAADRAGDLAAGWLQGDRVVTALWDEVPGGATLRTNRGYKAVTRPLLRWGAGLDLWGAQSFRVLLDGAELTTTTAESVKAPRLRDGAHKWQVVSVDARGQQTPSKARYVRVDTRPPTVKLVRRSGHRLRAVITDAGAGVAQVRLQFGDGSRTGALKPPEHRYAGAGRYRLVLRAVDRLGHVLRKRVTVTIR